MKKLILILMLGSLFSKEPIVTILGKSGIYVTGTIKKYEDGWITIDSKKGKIGDNITIDGGTTNLDIKDILLIDYGIKTPIGRYNLELIPKMGANLIIFRPNMLIHKKLIRIDTFAGRLCFPELIIIC